MFKNLPQRTVAALLFSALLLTSVPMVLFVSQSLPAQTLADLIRYLKERPGKLNYASTGIGHPIHKPADPRVARLLAVARANGFGGNYIKLMQLIQKRAEKVYRKELPMNATGAIGAICCEMDLPHTIVRGLGVMARAVGLVGHILEESRQPMALEIWHRVEDEASAHTRGRFRKPAKRKAART